MRIRVIPYADLRRRVLPGGGDSRWLELADGATVGEALQLLDIHIREGLIAGLDGEYATLDTPLRDGAELILVTPMEGG